MHDPLVIYYLLHEPVLIAVYACTHYYTLNLECKVAASADQCGAHLDCPNPVLC